MTKSNGVEETAFTVQYDFVMPGRFDLKFVDSNGEEKRPLVVHRSSIGAIERIAAFLLEHFDGALPLWLSPVQVKVIPISEKVMEYALEVTESLKKAGVRVELDTDAESLGKKIRNAEAMKIPYMIIVGEKEAENKTVSLRARGQKDLGMMSVEEVIVLVASEIKEKKI